MNFAIIGAGNIGGNLARLLTTAGHRVAIANSRDPESLRELQAETGALPKWLADVADGADVVIVSIPLINVTALDRQLFSRVAAGFVVIDTNNYYPQRDGHIAEIEQGMTESRWVSNEIGQPVVKAFNGISYRALLANGRTEGDPDRQALPVAGDDEVAKARVMEVLNEVGFDAVDAGSIDESWKQQPGSPVYGARTDVEGVVKLLAEATSQRHPDWMAERNVDLS